MTGSRLLFWLHALTSAFNDSGYWSGVVICFSMRQPITRASIDESSMFMDRDYHRPEPGGHRILNGRPKAGSVLRFYHLALKRRSESGRWAVTESAPGNRNVRKRSRAAVRG